MVVLRRGAGTRRSPAAAMDVSSEFLSLQPGGRRTSRERAAPADYSSGSIECFNGHCLRSMRKSILRCSDSSFEESMAILSENVNRGHFSRQLTKLKSDRKKEYNAVTRTLRTRDDAKTARRVHGENGGLELRRSCRVRRSRYPTTNSSVLFDKFITNTAEVVLQKMDEIEQIRRCRRRRWEDVEEKLGIFTCVKPDFERTAKPSNPDEIVVQTSGESENKENDGEDIPKRYNLRQRKPVERYQAPLEIKPKEQERTYPDQPPSVRQKETLENSGSQKSCDRRRTRRRRGASTSDSTPSCSSPSLDSTCDTDESGESSEDSESTSTRRDFPVKLQKRDLKRVQRDQKKVGGSQGDQMQIDSALGFDNVGGLSEHIAALKEMVIFPLLYPEVFERFNIQPPRGCLFYGPPGTGKTLVARALASECSRGDRKISFFMRKASDCMRKYVGESERQLHSLFEQAYQMRPSIIFFDEIDGLAPVRSSKQDYIHSSIVSTLLTLMDGIDNRGEIVVIGATNRLDSIDPALRRPGRFDREFLFNLPNKEARQEIFKIHTRDWIPKPPDMLLDELAEKCIGYCGADIKSLCVEAALCSLRRCYPQIYASREKLQLDVNSIKIKAKDFFMALKKVVPASNRIMASPGQALSPIFKPLFENSVANILQAVQKIFPHAQLALKKDRQQDHLNPILQDDIFDSDDDASPDSGDELTDKMPDRPEEKFLRSSRSAFCEPTSCRPHLLIVGKAGYGQVSYVAPAVLHALEKFPVHTLDLPILFTGVAPPEEICGQLIRNAQKTAPSIIYVPDIHLWWDNVGPALKLTFLTLLQNIPAFSPVLLLATSDVCHSDLPEEIQKLFIKEFGEVYNIELPGKEERTNFFEDIILNQTAKPPIKKAVHRTLEVLPVAPPPEPQEPPEEDVGLLEEEEEDTLRELRIFLRDVTQRLATDRRFKEFTKPIDPQKVPDYATRIKEPMDLSTVLTKIDSRQYLTAGDFLKDIDLICNNALEYHPDQRPAGRHRAYTLQDTAYSMVRNEMDAEFRRLCDEIKESREKRGRTSPVRAPCNDSEPPQQNPATEYNKPDQDSNANAKMRAAPVDASTPLPNGVSERKRRRNKCARAVAKRRRSFQCNKENRVPIDDQNDSGEEEFLEKHVSGIYHTKHGAEKESAKLAGYSAQRWETLDSEEESSNDSWTLQMTPTQRSRVEQQQMSVENNVEASTEPDHVVIVDRYELKKLFHAVIELTKGFDIFHLEKVYGMINQCIYKHREDYDKTGLVEMISELSELSRNLCEASMVQVRCSQYILDIQSSDSRSLNPFVLELLVLENR
ncbi:ATPase family AAA domain-containing protein 2 [Oxyura jamaicensis]|uniref:ATPase family AAA domain-containing protein 2 n=1 Tax=Oxyura jamaicensis TaxID=8884 RepID=UPI0015A62509|nr:ATPase family AAA domain-containing protein 2 [Oxyura jamaicensis]